MRPAGELLKNVDLFWKRLLEIIVWIVCQASLIMIGFSYVFLRGFIIRIKRPDDVNFVTHDPQATIGFYCDIMGLTLGNKLSIDTSQSLYFCIPKSSIAILHVGNAKADKNQPKFKRFADLESQYQGTFSTGALDHFCLAVIMINSLSDLIRKNWIIKPIVTKKWH